MVPVLSAWKGLSIGWRIATIVAPILLLAAIWGWGWFAGRESCQDAHHAEMMAQAVSVAEHTIARSEGQETVDEQHQVKETAREQKERVVVKEVIKYVQAKKEPCVLDAEYVRLVDELSQLRESANSGLPEAEAPAGGGEELQAERTTVSQLLLAWVALSNARQRDAGMIQYMQASDAARYANEMRFWMGLPAEARGESE